MVHIVIFDGANSNTPLQKQLFTENEWSYIQDYFTEKDHLPHLSKDFKERILGLVKLITSGQFIKAYNRCLKYVTKVPTDDTWLFKVLAHVLNCYNERTEIFQSNFDSTTTTTECNYMAKLWYKVFELMFGTTQLHPKWGESVPDATTAIKLVNNNNKSHTIGCKIDGRILYKDNQSIDFCHMEASKTKCTESKVQKDKVKLAIETKCSLDSIISKSTQPTLKRSITLPNLVISGIEAQANSLALVDYGLYVSSVMFDLSLPDNITLFGEEMTTWCRKLKSLRSMCLKNSAICTALSSPPRKHNLAQETLDDQQGTDVKDWVRGTFTIPTNGPALFPKHFLTSPIAPSNTVKSKAAADFIVSILSDGTKVKRRVHLQDCTKKKRKSRRTVDDNPGHKRKPKHQSHNAANTNHHPESNAFTRKKSKGERRGQVTNN
ncbi:hypothetical protein MBANPS3_011445 [Mucor bainieri]